MITVEPKMWFSNFGYFEKMENESTQYKDGALPPVKARNIL
jgi:hypothetical protein